MRHPAQLRLQVLASLLCLLAGCAGLLENVPPRPEASPDREVVEAEFPRLADVPARPRLGYTLEQRREIAQGLIADRANARYAGDGLREDHGRPARPDDPPILPPAPAPRGAPAGTAEAELVQAYVEEALARAEDDGSLGDFLDRLEQRPVGLDIDAAPEPASPAGPTTPPTASPAAEAQDDGATTGVAPAAAEADLDDPVRPNAKPRPDDADTTAADSSAEGPQGPSAAPASTPPPAMLPISIPFAPDEMDVAEDQQAALRALAPAVNGSDRVLLVSGGGERAGLAMERARRVAAILVGAGLDPRRITLEMGGESDVVVVYETGDDAG